MGQIKLPELQVGRSGTPPLKWPIEDPANSIAVQMYHHVLALESGALCTPQQRLSQQELRQAEEKRKEEEAARWTEYMRAQETGREQKNAEAKQKAMDYDEEQRRLAAGG